MVNRRHAGGLALVCALVRQIDMSCDGKTSPSGVRCYNLEVTLGGGARQSEILLLGAHYD
jgi:hypothetical protein